MSLVRIKTLPHPAHRRLYCCKFVLHCQAGIEAVLASVRRLNPGAAVYLTASEVSVDRPELVKGKAVLW